MWKTVARHLWRQQSRWQGTPQILHKTRAVASLFSSSDYVVLLFWPPAGFPIHCILWKWISFHHSRNTGVNLEKLAFPETSPPAMHANPVHHKIWPLHSLPQTSRTDSGVSLVWPQIWVWVPGTVEAVTTAEAVGDRGQVRTLNSKMKGHSPPRCVLDLSTGGA